MRKWILGFLMLFGVSYVVLLGVVYAQMRSSPGSFNAFMTNVPMPVMMGIPFQPMWFRARAGTVSLGQAAPDFELRGLHEQSRVRLSAHRGERPVLLVFGSYT